MTEDPFERAAKREQRMEMLKQRQKESWSDDFSRTAGTGKALRVFLLPYVIWGLIRAANYEWSGPPLAESLLDFFFGSGVGFAIFTGFILFLLWVWLIQGGRQVAATRRANGVGASNTVKARVDADVQERIDAEVQKRLDEYYDRKRDATPD